MDLNLLFGENIGNSECWLTILPSSSQFHMENAEELHEDSPFIQQTGPLWGKSFPGWRQVSAQDIAIISLLGPVRVLQATRAVPFF